MLLMQGDKGPHLQVVVISSVQASPGNFGRWRSRAPVASPHRLFFQPPPSTAFSPNRPPQPKTVCLKVQTEIPTVTLAVGPCRLGLLRPYTRKRVEHARFRRGEGSWSSREGARECKGRQPGSTPIPGQQGLSSVIAPGPKPRPRAT